MQKLAVSVVSTILSKLKLNCSFINTTMEIKLESGGSKSVRAGLSRQN